MEANFATQQNLTSSLRENRVFAPPGEFAAKAHVKSLEEYEALYARSIADPEAFWADIAKELHWFTPWKARRMLRAEGFKAVYDRWDLRGEDEGGEAYRLALRLIRSGRLAKLAADVVVPECSYAATK